MNATSIRAVVFSEGDHLVAQCLEYDFAVQGKGIRELRKNFAFAFASHVVFAVEHKCKPFEGVQHAPDKFWKMFEAAEKVKRQPLKPAVKSDPKKPSPPLPQFAELALA
jgi:hypothetical protein